MRRIGRARPFNAFADFAEHQHAEIDAIFIDRIVQAATCGLQSPPLIRSALVDEALQTGLRTRLEEMRQRLSRLEERGAKKRQLALEAMCEVGLKKLEQPDFTASARTGASPLVIIAEDMVPESYWVPQPPKLDRQSLLADLKHGDVIPGAQLGNPQPCLAVRTK